MKVETIKIKKFKSIQDFEANINEKNIFVIGENEKGKSSLLEFINIACGAKPKGIDLDGGGEVVFIKDGKEIKSKIEFKDGKPVLKISGDGISINNNKSAIAELFGATNFDINEFLEWSKTTEGQKKQVEFFENLFDDETRAELAKHKANIANNYSERTEINKEIKNFQGIIKASKLGHLPDFELRKIEQKNLDSLLTELQAQQKKNHKIISFKEKMFLKEGEINELKEKIKELNEKLAKSESELQSGFEWLNENKEVDTTALSAELKNITENNNNFFEAEKLLSAYKKIKELEENSGELTALIDSSRQALQTAIKDMSDKIEGLSYNEAEQLTFEGIPVTSGNLSFSQAKRLYVAITKSKQNNGILLIENCESIGTERMKEIFKIAEENNLQIIGEEVRRGLNELQIEFANIN